MLTQSRSVCSVNSSYIIVTVALSKVLFRFSDHCTVMHKQEECISLVEESKHTRSYSVEHLQASVPHFHLKDLRTLYYGILLSCMKF